MTHIQLESKEDLFCHIVDPTARELLELFSSLTQKEFKSLDSGVDNDMILVDFLYHHRDSVRLLLESSDGTKYETFRENLFSQMEKTFLLFFQTFGSANTDPKLIKIITQLRIKSYTEIIRGDYTMEHAYRLVKQLGIYAHGGFLALTTALKQNKDVKNPEASGQCQTKRHWPGPSGFLHNKT